jgi:hypothetical protein
LASLLPAAASSLEKGFGKNPLYQREGGSIPIVANFKKLQGTNPVPLRFGLPDQNVHACKEFINLENSFGEIRTSAHYYNKLPNF